MRVNVAHGPALIDTSNFDEGFHSDVTSGFGDGVVVE